MNTNEMLDALNHANGKITFTVSLFSVVTILLGGLNCFYVSQFTRAASVWLLCVAKVHTRLQERSVFQGLHPFTQQQSWNKIWWFLVFITSLYAVWTVSFTSSPLHYKSELTIGLLIICSLLMHCLHIYYLNRTTPHCTPWKKNSVGFSDYCLLKNTVQLYFNITW